MLPIPTTRTKGGGAASVVGVIVCSEGLRSLVVRGFTTCTHAQNHSLMIIFFNTYVRAELSTLEDSAEARSSNSISASLLACRSRHLCSHTAVGIFWSTLFIVLYNSIFMQYVHVLAHARPTMLCIHLVLYNICHQPTGRIAHAQKLAKHMPGFVLSTRKWAGPRD